MGKIQFQEDCFEGWARVTLHPNTCPGEKSVNNHPHISWSASQGAEQWARECNFQYEKMAGNPEDSRVRVNKCYDQEESQRADGA